MDIFSFDSFERTPARDAPLSALGNREKSNGKNKTSNAPARVTPPSGTCNLFLNIDRTLCVLARVRPSPSRARWKRTVNERIRVVPIGYSTGVRGRRRTDITRSRFSVALFFFFFFLCLPPPQWCNPAIQTGLNYRKWFETLSTFASKVCAFKGLTRVLGG